MTVPMIHFSPGPTQLHPTVVPAIKEAEASGLLSASHRGPAFARTLATTVEGLRELLAIPPGHRVLFLGSATECMDRLLWSAVAERSHHFVNGAFARRFQALGQELGLRASAVEADDGEGFPLEDAPLEDALLGMDEGVELMALTQNETSTGVALPPAGIRRLGERFPAPLLAVDLVSGWPYARVPLEGVDAAFFSVQKGFGLPAGLGVLVASPRLLERARQVRESHPPRGGGHHGLLSLAQAADRGQTVATPNMLAIHLLGVVTNEYLRRGVASIRAETERKAELLYGAVDRLPGWRPFVPDPRFHSPTIVVAHRDPGAGQAPDEIRGHLRYRGMEVGGGYGSWKGRHLRFANFPVHSLEAAERLADALGEVGALSR